jgi:hypothetical protein
MGDASPKAHRERVERGVSAALAYLQAQFPGYTVETQELSSDDFARSVRSFRVRKGSEQFLMRVSDEVLDLATDGVNAHLQKFGVARALRQVSSGMALLVTTSGTSTTTLIRPATRPAAPPPKREEHARPDVPSKGGRPAKK